LSRSFSQKIHKNTIFMSSKRENNTYGLLFLTIIPTVQSYNHSSFTICRGLSSSILIAFPLWPPWSAEPGIENIVMCSATRQFFFCLLPQDKFRLDLSEEEAVQYMQNLIDVSATAIMAAMVERLHSLAQYWRK
jgi:hypothetical protein